MQKETPINKNKEKGDGKNCDKSSKLIPAVRQDHLRGYFWAGFVQLVFENLHYQSFS